VKPDAIMDPWGRKMQYRNPGKHNAQGYDVFSFGPDGVESADDVGNW
jgi:general secretion pathway protein G